MAKRRRRTRGDAASAGRAVIPIASSGGGVDAMTIECSMRKINLRVNKRTCLGGTHCAATLPKGKHICVPVLALQWACSCKKTVSVMRICTRAVARPRLDSTLPLPSPSHHLHLHLHLHQHILSPDSSTPDTTTGSDSCMHHDQEQGQRSGINPTGCVPRPMSDICHATRNTTERHEIDGPDDLGPQV